MDKQLFRKQKNTGMLKTLLSDGAEINGKTVSAGWHVIRPGNTVLCIPSELGVMGARQFDALSSAPVEAVLEVVRTPVVKLALQKRGASNFWDVVNPLNPDKPLNTKALSKKAASELLSQLLEEPISDDLSGLPWDSLVDILEREGGTVPEEVETEEDLCNIIRKNRG